MHHALILFKIIVLLLDEIFDKILLTRINVIAIVQIVLIPIMQYQWYSRNVV